VQVVLMLTVVVLAMLPRQSPRLSQSKCGSNLRQIGQGLLLYTNDHGPKYPPTLELLIDSAELHPSVFVCPAVDAQRPAAGATTREIIARFKADPKAHCSYVYVGAMMHANLPSDNVVAYEPLENHSGTGMNVLYNDGHVEWVDAVEGRWIIGELNAGRNPPSTRPSGTLQQSR
jgi:prepilin-type processing-associated H-X9-DG protein